jgi:predicted RNase H-like nuclease
MRSCGICPRSFRVGPEHAILALDIPIGLPDAGPRECDRRVREYLGRPRQTSVFPAPIRPSLVANTREEACQITQAHDGRKVGAQSWGLYPKIRELDELLQSSEEARHRTREVHPEVSFAAWAGGRAMTSSKKAQEGRAERCKLVEAWLGRGVLSGARGDHLKKDVGDDDILDAIAAAWTATRVADAIAICLPETPSADSTGLKMAIWY